MKRIGARWLWLAVALALAAGEAVGLISGGYSVLWPLAAIASALVVLFGYGHSWRCWPYVALLFAGMALAAAQVETREQVYRERFWLRDRPERRTRVTDAATGGWLPDLRADLSRRIGIGLDHDDEAAALNRAILLGERRHLPRQTRQVFVNAGTMHIFAVSGLHVMLVVQVLMMLLRLATFPSRFAGALAIPLVWAYVGMLGFPPSAVRAAAMISLYLAAPLCYRRPDSLVAWAQTFVVVHLISPTMLFDTGSALSFAVMLGILLWLRLMRGFSRPLLAFGGVSVAAWAAGVPIAAHVFGRVTPGGLVANAFLVPAAWYGVFAGVLGTLSSYVSTALAAHLNNFSALITRAMVIISTLVSRLPGANLEVRRWTVWECFAWYAVIGLSVWLVRSVWRRRHLI